MTRKSFLQIATSLIAAPFSAKRAASKEPEAIDDAADFQNIHFDTRDLEKHLEATVTFSHAETVYNKDGKRVAYIIFRAE